jgi:cellulase/cellobiase CelA1
MQITDSSLSAKAASVAQVPTFIWLDSLSKVPDLDTYMSDASKQGGKIIMPIGIVHAYIFYCSWTEKLLPPVIYDLPNRDCHALASNGEFTIANNGVANYKNYIDQIVAIVKSKWPPPDRFIKISLNIDTKTIHPLRSSRSLSLIPSPILSLTFQIRTAQTPRMLTLSAVRILNL